MSVRKSVKISISRIVHFLLHHRSPTAPKPLQQLPGSIRGDTARAGTQHEVPHTVLNQGLERHMGIQISGKVRGVVDPFANYPQYQTPPVWTHMRSLQCLYRSNTFRQGFVFPAGVLDETMLQFRTRTLGRTNSYQQPEILFQLDTRIPSMNWQGSQVILSNQQCRPPTRTILLELDHVLCVLANFLFCFKQNQ